MKAHFTIFGSRTSSAPLEDEVQLSLSLRANYTTHTSWYYVRQESFTKSSQAWPSKTVTPYMIFLGFMKWIALLSPPSVFNVYENYSHNFTTLRISLPCHQLFTLGHPNYLELPLPRIRPFQRAFRMESFRCCFEWMWSYM